MGQIVDNYWYTPELFQRDYYVADKTFRASEKIRNIMSEVYRASNGNPDLEELRFTVLAKGREAEYQNSYKDDTLINNILNVSGGADYYGFLVESGGRIVITQAEFVTAQTIKAQFEMALAQITIGEKVQHQVPLYFDIFHEKGIVSCKGLLDNMVTSKAQKFRNIDSKVTNMPHRKYKVHAKALGYDFQGSFYQEGLETIYGKENVDLPGLLVYSTVDKSVHYYPMTENDMLMGKVGATCEKVWTVNEGGPQVVSTSRIFGFNDAIELHLANQPKDASYGEGYSSHVTIEQPGLWE